MYEGKDSENVNPTVSCVSCGVRAQAGRIRNDRCMEDDGQSK